jgi:hypothetical protein
MLGLSGFLALVVIWGIIYLGARWLHRRGSLGPDWHRDMLALAVLELAVVAFYWPLFFTESWIPKGGGDLASFIYPIYVFSARWLKRGVVPLWNPHLYLGMPFAADNQTGLFYPINLIFFLLTPELTYQAVELMAVLHVFLAGLFSYILLRSMLSPRQVLCSSRASIGRIPAVAGAITFMFSDLFVVHPGNLNIIATAAWLPLVLCCFQRALQRKSWGWAGASGLTLGIAASVGHAQMFLYICMALGAYTLFQVYVDRQAGWRIAARHVAQLALTGILAAGLAALAIVPAYDMTQYTVRASMTYAQASDFALHPAGLIGLLSPGFWGRGTGTFWGPWLRTEMGYVGVLPLLLAAVAVTVSFRRYAWTRFSVLLAILGLLIALGGYTVLHGWTYALVPLFRQLRVPARAILLSDLAIAILAAIGLDMLLHPLGRKAAHNLATLVRGLSWMVAGLALIAIPLMGHAMIVTRMSPEDVRLQGTASMGSLIFFLILAAASFAVLALRRHRLASPPMLGTLSVCLIAFDLISLGAYIEIEPNDPLTGYEHEREIALLRADPDVFRVETAAEVQGGWAPDWSLIYEMDDLSGIWNPLRLGAYDVLTWVGIQRQDRFYDLYNVKYLIARADTPVPAHFEPVLQDGERVIYRNNHALPRAFMVYHADVVGGDTRALQIARAEDFDPARQIVLKQHPEALPLDNDPGAQEPEVKIADRGPNHISLAVTTPVDGYLFVGEMWLPGWTAYIDGEKQSVLKADYTFRAVFVPSGSHTVHMVYRPRSWLVGLGISLATAAALLVWGILTLYRRNRYSRRSE